MTGADTIRVRTASAAEVLPLAQPLLPHTVQLVADLIGQGPARRTRVHLAQRGDEPLGAVVLGERCRGRWYASPIVLDADAAVPLAHLIERSPAWEIGGPSVHVDPLVPHLTRTARRTPIRESFYAADVPSMALSTDPRCRPGRGDDLDALVDLYADYEFLRFPTRPRLREFLGRQLGSLPVSVAEVEGELAASNLCLYRAPGYDMWGDLVVRPQNRRQGLAMALGIDALLVSGGVGQRICAVQAGANPMRVERAQSAADGLDVSEGAWTQQPLQSPRRFPGHRRLRRAIERLEGPLERRPTAVGDSESG